MPQASIDIVRLEWIAGLLHVLLNIGVCLAVGLSGRFTRLQTVFQTLLVWLLPIVGVTIVGIFLWTEFRPGRFSRQAMAMVQ
jgi:hypothetical protein